ncbi:Lysine-specific histone demethylase 1A [Teratosphaeria destructans]|uniref:Lysine-specific histone demethylase 1A n=1 Tax=Teratosphaeria destructans TaxID=418781 RepID=A0A9W7SU64_9PEZI|nr:Lysine-specific histone demethylase 1A [Teratosphaeria destructans]
MARLGNTSAQYATSDLARSAQSPRSSDEGQDVDEDDEHDQASLSIAPTSALATSGPAHAAAVQPDLAIQSHTARRLKKTSSFVRLSMSSDGNASVVTKDGESPSPPRPPPVINLPGIRSTQGRAASGRSRDSRAWEFWCDKDSRSELEEKAERDSNGDAANAIGLLRSASGRSILGSIPNKRNSLLSRAPSQIKRQKSGTDERQPLQRSQTSFGRLQGKASSNIHKAPKLKHAGSAKSIHIPGNDSDKENWSPDSDRPFSSHPADQSSLSRPVEPLATDDKGSTGAVGTVAGDRAPGGENMDPEKDAELAAFMGRGGKRASTSSDAFKKCSRYASRGYCKGETNVLLQHGFKVTMFEARDRLGGRVAQSSHLGHIVDLGPNWLHGTADNPIAKIAEETQIQLHGMEEDEFVIQPDGTPLKAAEADQYARALWDGGLIAEAFKYSNEHHDSIDSSRSLYDFFREQVEKLFVNEPAEVARQKRQTLLLICQMWGSYVGSPVTKQSLKFFWLEECLEGENPFVAGTYSRILDAVKRPAEVGADLRLRSIVTRIESNGGTEDGSREPSIIIADGSRHTFDEVIVTTPLGWLKRNKHAFQPRLPDRLSQAIDSIGYGTLDKVYITFPSAFWDAAAEGRAASQKGCIVSGLDPGHKTPNVTATTMPVHQPGSTTAGAHHPCFTHWLTPGYAPDTNPHRWDQQGMNLACLPEPCAHPTLLFYTYGDCSLHIANLVSSATSDADRDAKILSFYEPYISRLPNYDPGNPACKPKAVLATAWANDEFAGYGSYSNFQVGLERGDEDIEVMRHGMPERGVWLAGEHTAPFVALGTTTGAWWSGEAVAERIVNAYRDSVGDRSEARLREAAVLMLKGNNHSSSKDAPKSMQKSLESPTRRPEGSGVSDISKEEPRRASASGSDGARDPHSLHKAESANPASTSQDSTDSRADLVAVQKGLAKPDQPITSTRRQSGSRADTSKATRLADWRDGMDWDEERGEYDRVTEAQMRRLLAEEASEDAHQPQSFLHSEGHIYHRQLHACIRNILRDGASLVRAGRELNTFVESQRTQELERLGVRRDEEEGEVVFTPLIKKSRPEPLEEIVLDLMAVRRAITANRIKEARADGDLPAQPLNEFQRKLMEDPILPLRPGEESPLVERLRLQSRCGRLGDYEPGFGGISMTKSEMAIRRRRAREVQRAAAQGPAAESEARNEKGPHDGASTDQQQDRASTERSPEGQKKTKRKKQKRRKKKADAEADEGETGSPATSGETVLAAPADDVAGPSEEAARHDSHQRSRDGSLADLIAELEARLKAIR